jgi:mRNA interferase RelE/StbE
MYQIEFSKQAAKALKAMPRNVAATIRAKIEALHDPYAPNPNAKPLEGTEQYRLRVGDWRVVYEIQDSCLVVLIIRVQSRGSVYQ